MAYLELKNLEKTFGGVRAVKALSLSLAHGQRLGILGRSGSGKTTLLRLIAGLDSLDAGEIVIDSETVSTTHSALTPEKRNLAMVFQSLGLWPHLTAHDHLDLILRQQRIDKLTRESEIQRLLQLTQIADKTMRLPGQLSGGERQRLALARALAQKPRLLLLDEPFAHVDEPLRDDLSQVLVTALQACQSTAIIVSHDGPHLASLCDEIAVMENGSVTQKATYRQLYDQPSTASVAQMTGPCFFMKVTHNKSVLCIRPEQISLGPDHQAVVQRSVFVAGQWRIHFLVNGQEMWMWNSKPEEAGAVLNIGFGPGALVPDDSTQEDV